MNDERRIRDACLHRKKTRHAFGGSAGFFVWRSRSLFGGYVCSVMPVAVMLRVVFAVMLSVMPCMVLFPMMRHRAASLIRCGRRGLRACAQFRGVPFNGGGTRGVGATGYAG
jgi:hypothetical protein